MLLLLCVYIVRVSVVTGAHLLCEMLDSQSVTIEKMMATTTIDNDDRTLAIPAFHSLCMFCGLVCCC